MLSLLSRSDFRLLWVAHTISILGDYVFFIAMTFWVYARTGSSLAVGAILIASGLPITLIAPLAGRVVDRWPKTTVMTLAEGSRAILFLALLGVLLVWPMSLLPCYVVGCLQSFIAAFFWAGRGAILPDLVDGARLEAANALYQFCDGVVRIIAPTLAAFVLLTFSVACVTAFDAATFLLSASLLAMLAATPLFREKRAFSPTGAMPTAKGETLSSESVAPRAARAVFLLGGLLAFVAGTFSVALPILARQQLSAGPLLYGLMVTAQALGEVGMSLLLGHSHKPLTSEKTLIGCFAMSGLALAALHIARMVALALALNLCIGAASGAITIQLLTCLQRRAPASRLGHQMALFGAAQAFAQLSGIGLASLSAPSIGVMRLLVLDSLLYVGAACWIWLARGATD